MAGTPDYAVAEGFKTNLKRHRERAGYSQEELGFLAGIHRTEVGMLERGIRIPRIDTLIKLASALEVPPGELLAGIEWAPGRVRFGSFTIGDPEEGEEGGGDG